jgi:hypothetical protein
MNKPIDADDHFSPCDWPEVTVWVIVLESVVAHCDRCGVVVRGPVAPMFTHGWYCVLCAAGLRVPTWAEVLALGRNAAATFDAGEPVTKTRVRYRTQPSGEVTDGLIRADGTVRKMALTPAMRAGLEKAWAAKRAAKAGRPTEP